MKRCDIITVSRVGIPAFAGRSGLTKIKHRNKNRGSICLRDYLSVQKTSFLECVYNVRSNNPFRKEMNIWQE